MEGEARLTSAIKLTFNPKEIADNLDRMESAGARGADFLQADINFHLAVGRAAHNSILMNALHLIRNLLLQPLVWSGGVRSGALIPP